MSYIGSYHGIYRILPGMYGILPKDISDPTMGYRILPGDLKDPTKGYIGSYQGIYRILPKDI